MLGIVCILCLMKGLKIQQATKKNQFMKLPGFKGHVVRFNNKEYCIKSAINYQSFQALLILIL